MKTLKEITIEDLYEVAANQLASEFGMNRHGEAATPKELDQDFVNRAFDTKVDGETVGGIMDCMIDDLLDAKLLKTRKDRYGLIVVELA